jgi:hypothetical protein
MSGLAAQLQTSSAFQQRMLSLLQSSKNPGATMAGKASMLWHLA